MTKADPDTDLDFDAEASDAALAAPAHEPRHLPMDDDPFYQALCAVAKEISAYGLREDSLFRELLLRMPVLPIDNGAARKLERAKRHSRFMAVLNHALYRKVIMRVHAGCSIYTPLVYKRYDALEYRRNMLELVRRDAGHFDRSARLSYDEELDAKERAAEGLPPPGKRGKQARRAEDGISTRVIYGFEVIKPYIVGCRAASRPFAKRDLAKDREWLPINEALQLLKLHGVVIMTGNRSGAKYHCPPTALDTMVQLGWMDATGKITAQAPP